MFRKIIQGHKDVWCGTLEFDTEPKNGSFNPVTSDGVYAAINGAGGAKEIVYFDVDPSDPPSGIYAAITAALSNGKEPVIKNGGAVYFYSATGTNKYVFVGGYKNEAVGYTEFTVSSDDSVTSKSVDDKVFNMYLLYKTDPASPGDPPGDEDSWVCDANKHVITKDELVAAHADCRYFILNNDVEPGSNSRKYFAAVTNISDSYVQLRFYMLEYSGDGAANFYQKTVSDDSEGRLYISDSYQDYLAGTNQAVLVSEPQSFDSTQKAQGRDNIGAAAASDVTALQTQVSSLSNVSAYSVKGEATVAQLNAGPSGIQAGWAYQLTDSGTLTEGTLAVVAGDTVAWDGTKWFPLVKSDYYAPKTYAENVAASIAPEFDPTRDYVVDESCTYEGTAYIFTSNHPAGAWNSAHATISGQNALLRLTSMNAVKVLDLPASESCFPWSPKWINKSISTSTGNIGTAERLDRATTKYYNRNHVFNYPRIIKAGEGVSFTFFAYGSGQSYIGKIGDGDLKELGFNEIKSAFVGDVLYFRIVAQNDDASNIDVSTFDGITIVEDDCRLVGQTSDFFSKRLVSQQIGYTNQSLYGSTGEVYGNNTKRLLSDFIPVERIASVNGISDDYVWSAFVYDVDKKFIGRTSDYSAGGLRSISSILSDAGATSNGRFVRLYLKHTVTDVDQDITFSEISHYQVNLRQFNSFRLELECGSLSLNSGKFLPSSTTLESDNSSGFYGHLRSGKFVKVSSPVVKLVFTQGLVKLFEYDDNRYLVDVSDVTSNVEIALSPATKFIKVMATNSACPDIQFLCYDSEISYSYNDDSAYSEHSYIYQVPSNVGLDVMVDDATITQYANNTYFYNSLTFKLPPNYKAEGKPVPLIFFCHGSHAMESRLETTMSADYQPFLEYLNAEGYAVLDCCSQSTKFADGGRLLHNSNPDDMACIASAIKWFADNFNVEKDIYIMCKSRGGNAALSMAYSPCYRVKASALLAPSISCFSREYIFSYENTVRKNFALDMGFDEVDGLDETCLELANQHQPTSDAKKYVRGNASKLINQCSTFVGFAGSAVSDMVDALVDFDYDDAIFETTPRDLPVPTKIWIAPDDTQVSYSEVLKWQTTVKLGHGVACIRTLPSGTGGHHAVDTDENALKVSSIVTRLGLIKTNVPLAYVEAVRWFRQFE